MAFTCGDHDRSDDKNKTHLYFLPFSNKIY